MFVPTLCLLSCYNGCHPHPFHAGPRGFHTPPLHSPPPSGCSLPWGFPTRPASAHLQVGPHLGHTKDTALVTVSSEHCVAESSSCFCSLPRPLIRTQHPPSSPTQLLLLATAWTPWPAHLQQAPQYDSAPELWPGGLSSPATLTLQVASSASSTCQGRPKSTLQPCLPSELLS